VAREIRRQERNASPPQVARRGNEHAPPRLENDRALDLGAQGIREPQMQVGLFQDVKVDLAGITALRNSHESHPLARLFGRFQVGPVSDSSNHSLRRCLAPGRLSQRQDPGVG